MQGRIQDSRKGGGEGTADQTGENLKVYDIHDLLINVCFNRIAAVVENSGFLSFFSL